MLVLATGRPDITVHYSNDRGRSWFGSDALFQSTSLFAETTPKVFLGSHHNAHMAPAGRNKVLVVHDATREAESAKNEWLKRQGHGLIIGRIIEIKARTGHPTVTDIDGNVYQSVTIGKQVWLKENQRVTRYRNGDPIGTTTPANKDISGEFSPKYQWAYEVNERHVPTYGRLYTWHTAADSRGICPPGWRVPGEKDWQQLETFLGMEQKYLNYAGRRGAAEGGKLKERGVAHWLSPNTGAADESGFAARPGGYRFRNGHFGSMGAEGTWWSADETRNYYAWYRRLYNDDSFVGRFYLMPKEAGFSVRCIKE